MDRTGQHRDAVPPDLVTEVLAGDADRTRAGKTQDIHIQVVPLLSGNGVSGRHRSQASTSVLLASAQEVKADQKPLSPSLHGGSPPAVAERPDGLLGCPRGGGETTI